MKCLHLALLLTFLHGLSQLGWAKIEITETVTQFRFPHFSENGFIEWVLEGQSGRMEDAALAIEALVVRIYSSDRDNRQLGVVTGDNCQLDTESSIAGSDGRIEIGGSGFNLSGKDWNYDLKTKTIEIKSESVVHFSESVSRAFSKSASGESGTQIKCDSLVLVIEPNRYQFRFAGEVHLTSDSFDLRSDLLEVDLLNSSPKVEFLLPSGELSGMDRVEASGSVRFNSPEYNLRSDRLFLYPKKEHAFFDGAAAIQVSQALLKGDRIEFDRSQVHIESFENSLASFSLNAPVAEPDFVINSLRASSEILIQSERIYFEKKIDSYTYRFEERVRFEGLGYQIYSDQLIAETNSILAEDETSIFQELIRAQAEGSVSLKAESFEIRAQNLDFLPRENELKANESVDYISEFAQLFADGLLVKNDSLRAESYLGSVSVHLPNTLDFGFQLNNRPSVSAASDDVALRIQSKVFDLNKDGLFLNARFSQAVKVEQYSAELLSEQLDMVWKKEVAPVQGSNQTEYLVESVVAKESVTMTQGDFFASADQLSIYPEEERVSLFGTDGGARFEDANGTVIGERIDYDRRLKQTVVSGKSGSSRARIQFDLPSQSEDSLEENKN
ncbi:MAG: hypothetical protein CML12_01075 [Puniceicoccaceae bacterium]|nr:hypothetical protein [Puniceicoccaceae bacterium]